MELQFAYHALTKDNKTIQGYISAASAEEARKTLEAMNLSILDIQEAKIGRDNPFVPYYQIATSTTTPATK
jgi:type II secretory pathway component PulF